MRYAGQEHTLTVAVPSDDGAITMSAEEVHELFTGDYARTFALTMEEDGRDRLRSGDAANSTAAPCRGSGRDRLVERRVGSQRRCVLIHARRVAVVRDPRA